MEDRRIGLVLMLLREGSTRHAIDVFQEEAEVSFPIARQAVFELARQYGIPLRHWSALPLALLALAGLLLGLLLAR
ncbi:MAG: hypothetical protein ACYC3X_31060 [Pirellulaceae bacterium]